MILRKRGDWLAKEKIKSTEKISIPENSLQKDDQHDQTWHYWETARSPFASAVFVLPLLVLYEVCVYRLSVNELENGAHQWVNRLLTSVGIHDLVVPLVMLLILFVWQYLSRKSLEISSQTLLGMWAESVLFAMLLIGLGQAQQLAMIGGVNSEPQKVNYSLRPIFLQMETQQPLEQTVQRNLPKKLPSSQLTMHQVEHPRQRFISYLGAGIYEETIFRLLLIPILYFLFRWTLFSSSLAFLLTLLTSSFMFALAHEVLPIANRPPGEIPQLVIDSISGDSYKQFVFAFRAVAGLYFGLLFYIRGFGIAVGSHLVYDVFVGIMLKD
jgi:hypothetical protein